jgi:hypothetical protein
MDKHICCYEKLIKIYEKNDETFSINMKEYHEYHEYILHLILC